VPSLGTGGTATSTSHRRMVSDLFAKFLPPAGKFFATASLGVSRLVQLFAPDRDDWA
jgi:hypothetical protein